MGLKVRYNGTIVDFSDAKYNPNGYGVKRLNIRIGTAANAVKQYGLATSASHASDRRLRFMIDGVVHYIGTSATSSRQSDYTSYSSYYTSTYTSGYPQSSVLTRQGTSTTATKTMPVKYTYRASYYNGVASYYTLYSTYKNVFQTAYLSGTKNTSSTSQATLTRTSAYTVHYSYYDSWKNLYSYHSYSASLTKTTLRFPETTATSRTYTKTANLTSVHTRTITHTSPTGTGIKKTWVYHDLVEYGSFSTLRVRTATTKTKEDIIKVDRDCARTRTSPLLPYATLTSARASNYTVEKPYAFVSSLYYTQPNYFSVGATTSNQGGFATWTVVASNYKGNTSSLTYAEGIAANVSYRRVSQYRTTAGHSTATARTGAATLTSTTTPIGGVPANYTLSAGPVVISSVNSYTYTDAACTKTYVSNYSTSYWTVTSTLTSNPWYSSSLGQTATTRSSQYTTHNFI